MDCIDAVRNVVCILDNVSKLDIKLLLVLVFSQLGDLAYRKAYCYILNFRRNPTVFNLS